MRHGAARKCARVGTSVGTSSLPPAAAMAALSDRALIALAFSVVTIDTAALARALGVALDAVRHARRSPTTLPLAQRLTLAAIAGAEPHAAAVARELRRRTLAALNTNTRPIPSDQSATSATSPMEQIR